MTKPSKADRQYKSRYAVTITEHKYFMAGARARTKIDARQSTRLGAQFSEDCGDRRREEVFPTTRLHEICDEGDRFVRVRGVEAVHETWLAGVRANNGVESWGRICLVGEEPRGVGKR